MQKVMVFILFLNLAVGVCLICWESRESVVIVLRSRTLIMFPSIIRILSCSYFFRIRTINPSYKTSNVSKSKYDEKVENMLTNQSLQSVIILTDICFYNE